MMRIIQTSDYRIYLQQYSLKFCMLSKIKSLFAQQINPEDKQPDFKHPEVHGGDVSQCPFMSKKKNGEENPKDQDKKKDTKKNNQSDTESEAEEKPKGGCPFMVSTGTKKNPNLGIDHAGFDEPFVSKFKYYLSENKINFDLLKNGKVEAPIIRQKFDQYPIYLKHTLFYNGEDYKKVRSFECCSRFLAYEELRERGNKNFNKGRYLKAIDFYERAMSLFRWLEYKQAEQQSQMGSQMMIEQGYSQSEISQEESMSKVPINLDTQTNLKEEKKTQFDQFRQKNKEFFVVYHDDNVVSFDGEEMTEVVDTDMRKSLLIQIYLNMAAAYMKLNNFSLANRVLEDAFKLSDKVSQVYLRKAQVALSSRSSSNQDLRQGLKYIQTAICMQPNQKIFQNTNPNILKMVNIHDAKQVYASVCQKLKNRISEKEGQDQIIIASIEKRLKSINIIEQEMIREGKIPQEGSSNGLLSSGTDFKILRRIYDKYVRIMEFYIEAKDKTQVGLAKNEFQEILRVLTQIQNIEKLEIDTNNEEFGSDPVKIEKRIANIKKQKCQQIYNSAKYNFHVLEWAIKEVVKEEHQMQEKRKKQEEQAMKAQQSQNQSFSGKVEEKSTFMSKMPYALFLLPVVGFIVNYMI